MHHSFWKERWDESQLGFHRDSTNPNLLTHWRPLLESVRSRAAGTSRVLVPLCGKSLDLAWLDQQGHEVLGVEFVERAARDYFEERGLSPQRSLEQGRVCYQSGRTRIVVGDFFTLSSAELGPIDLVYDRAALVAIEPEQRERYARQLAALTLPGAGMLVISFEHDTGSGPPFSVPEVDRLFVDAFDVERVEQHDILEQEPRFRERGASHMDEVVWYLRRTVG